MFLKHYCVCWECFNDVLKTSLKNVKLRYLKNICMMFLIFYITFYLHLQNVIEKCFRYNMYITFIKCYKNVMCLLGSPDFCFSLNDNIGIQLERYTPGIK